MGLYAKYLFPHILNFAMSSEKFVDIRRGLLGSVKGETLEIGFGTGLNLPHYPATLTHVTAVDVNPGMQKLARRQIEPSGIEVRYETMDGEHLPFADELFDSIVSTWTLCSIPNVGSALSEIHRLLKPDGRFFFVEHGLSEDPAIQAWQRRFTPVQKVVGDGCHLDRDIESLIRSAGFRFIEIKKFYMEKVPRIGGYLYRGIARKDAAS